MYISSISLVIFSLYIAFLTVLASIFYRSLWGKILGKAVVPSGFGVILAFVLVGAALFGNLSFEIVASMVAILVGAVCYWLDDVIELSPLIRMIISFIVGIAIAYLLINWSDSYSLMRMFVVCFLVGILNVVFTNIVNFYDGADLNLATFMILTNSFYLIFSNSEAAWFVIAVASLAFIVPFSFINSRPKTIYLGDSGSFVFSSMLTVMAVLFFMEMHCIPIEAAIPFALPALDVFYVILIRIKKKHNLLTRNYLHLYQRLQYCYKGFGYIFPQIINALLCLMIAIIFRAYGLEENFSVLLSMLIVTVAFYYFCRRFFVNEIAGH